MSSSSASAKSILSGLGKATRRGVRRCPKCGTINGTRGLSCKNRNCDMIFKEGAKALSGNNCGVAGLGSKMGMDATHKCGQNTIFGNDCNCISSNGTLGGWRGLGGWAPPISSTTI